MKKKLLRQKVVLYDTKNPERKPRTRYADYLAKKERLAKKEKDPEKAAELLRWQPRKEGETSESFPETAQTAPAQLSGIVNALQAEAEKKERKRKKPETENLNTEPENEQEPATQD